MTKRRTVRIIRPGGRPGPQPARPTNGGGAEARPSRSVRWWSWVETHPGLVLTIILAVLGAIFTAGQMYGALMAPTRVDAVDAEVEVLKAEVTTLSNEIDALRETTAVTNDEIRALSTDVKSLAAASRPQEMVATRAEVDALRTQVEVLASYVEDLSEPPAGSNEVDALRAQVEALLMTGSNEVDALRTQVEALVQRGQADADVVNLRFLVETLTTRLASVTESDEIEVLSTQVEELRALLYCSIAQTEEVRQHLKILPVITDVLIILPSMMRVSTPESCTEFR